MLIQADLHTHTLASTHAFSTITENCVQAQKIGVKCIAMTDHAMAMPDSPHRWHFEVQSTLPRQICGVTVLKGVEANIINYDGDIDCKGKLLENFEWVIASHHSQTIKDYTLPDPNDVTAGYVKLFENPYVDVIGHPTTKKFPVEWERLVKAAKEYGKLLELNESSIRSGKSPRENVVEMLKMCKKYELEITVDSDAHFWSAIGQTSLSERILLELDFPMRLVANADWDALRERIHRKRPHLDL